MMLICKHSNADVQESGWAFLTKKNEYFEKMSLAPPPVAFVEHTHARLFKWHNEIMYDSAQSMLYDMKFQLITLSLQSEPWHLGQQ